METARCSVCNKNRSSECSHVECPKRKLITAQPVGEFVRTRAKDSPEIVTGTALVRVPFYFED